MYLSRKSGKTEALIESFASRPTCLAAKKAIVENNTLIFYHIDEVDGSLVYEFVRPDGSGYIKVEINSKGDIVVPEEYLTLAYHEPPSSFGGACLYIAEREKKIEEKGIAKDVYGDDADYLSSLLALTPRQLDRRASVRRDFVAMFEGNDAGSTSAEANYTPVSALKASFFFEPGYNYYGEESYSLKIVLNDGKERLGLVRSNIAFLNCFESGSVYSVRNGLRVNVGRSNFEKNSAEALDFYLSRVHFSEEAASLAKSDVVNLLFFLKGELVNFEGKDYLVCEKEATAGFHLTEEGGIHFSPSPSSNSTLLIAGPSLVVLDKERFSCELFRFQNATSSSLFLFYRSHPSSETDVVKDLIRRYVSPEEALANAEDANITDALKISLYVDLSERGILLFSTICHLNGHEETMEKLRENLYYRDKLNRYASILSRLGGVVNGSVREGRDVVRFLGGDLTELRGICTVFLSDTITKLDIVRNIPIQVDINRTAQNWLEMNISSSRFDPSDLERILFAYKKKYSYLRLGGQMIILDDPQIAEVCRIQKEVGMKDSLYSDHLPFYNAFKLASASLTHVGLNLSDYVTEALESIRDYTKKKLVLPELITEALRPYQKEAIQWMNVLSGYGLCGILADDMGLGKTLESIAFLSSRNDSRPTLVLCPKSVIYNWESEVRKWSPETPVTVIAGTRESRLATLAKIKRKEKAIYVVSYDSMRNDIEEFSKIHFGVVLADEAQFIKNSLSKKAKAVKMIKSDIRFALTGTPIENSLSDLWSIFDFLMPGYLLSYEDFKETYIDNESNKARERLLKRITPFILRRTKNQVLKDLPNKSVETVTLAMSDRQAIFYEASLIEARREVEEKKEGFSIFPIFTRLREIAVDPESFFEDFHEMSAKFEYLLTLVEEAIGGGHKMLIFSSFTKVLDNLRLALDEAGVDSRTIDGSTPAEERLSLAESFNTSDEFKVMLVSLKAGGTGLNLIGADIVVHLDPWWNPAAEEQATDRSYRIGQTRPVSVYKLVCHNSIEEKVLSLQESKKSLSDSLIKEGDSFIRKLTDDDIRFLLS